MEFQIMFTLSFLASQLSQGLPDHLCCNFALASGDHSNSQLEKEGFIYLTFSEQWQREWLSGFVAVASFTKLQAFIECTPY